MTIGPDDLLGVARKALANAQVYPTDVCLESYYKVGDEWHVDVVYTEPKTKYETTAALAVKTETGEIRGFWKGRRWK